MTHQPDLPDWELIEGFFSETLPPEYHQTVQQRLATDPAFRAQAQAWQQADRAMRQLARQQAARQTVRQEMQQMRWKTRIRRGAATVMTACLVGGLWLFSSVNITAYQQDLTLLRLVRADSTLQQAPLSERQQAFYRDYAEGQSYLADGQPALAIPYFERVLKTPNLRLYFQQAVQWQLVNAYLLAHRPANAQATLERLGALGDPIYPIQSLDRWRVRWQIGWQQLVR